MDEFHEQLTNTLRRKADEIDTSDVPLLPDYSSDPAGGRDSRSRTVGALATLVVTAVAIASISVLAFSRSDGASDGSPAAEPSTTDRLERDVPPTTTHLDADPPANGDGSEDDGARTLSQRHIDTEQSLLLADEARTMLPDYSVIETFEWVGGEGETMSVFVELEAPGGRLAKLAIYTVPNPAHAEILAEDPSLVFSGAVSWIVTDLTPEGRQVALLLMDRMDVDRDADDELLPDYIDGEAVAAQIQDLASRLD